MKISIVGTGYVGLVQGACFADSGNTVLCMDIDEKKISNLKKNIVPIYEPGLEDIIKRNIHEKRITFTTSVKDAVEKSDIIFLCLPTPQSEDGSADVSRVLKVAEQISTLAKGYKIVVSKSTVPVGTVDKVRQIIRKKNKEIDVVSNPEFLKEGSAILDSLKPDRVVIGTKSKKAADILTKLYQPFVRTGNPILIMDERSAELTKYAANSFLATKISFMNELANLCEKVGADVDNIRKGIGTDPRIGNQFLFSGIGYGGSCFPKDVKALIKTSIENEYEFSILRSVDEVNERQKRVLIKKINKHFSNKLKNKKIALWGLAFKPQTDDIREAPSLVIINALLESGAKISVHDPVAMHPIQNIYGKKLEYHENNYDAIKNADALIIVTEWNEFRRPDFKKMKTLMKHPVIFDGRNIYDPQEMKQRGLVYYGIGRKHE